MKICLIAEGCYPYVAGGVSSWIQMLIKGMPHHQFIIYTIAANMEQRGKFKYTIPDNVISVEENFLDQFLSVKIKKNHKYNLLPRERQAILDLISRDEVDWNCLFDMFSRDGTYHANEFLCSHAFMDIVMEACESTYRVTPFTQVFWTIRSMLLPVRNILSCPIPDVDVFHSVSTGYAGLLGAMFRYKTDRPYIITEHGIYTREREEEILKASWVDVYFKQTWIDFFMGMSRASYQKADRIVSLFYGARQLQTEIGADPDKCLVIPNGIDMKRFAHIPPMEDDGHPLALGAVVRVVPIKDIKTMIYAFDLVRHKAPDAKLYLIGPTDEDPEYYQECMDLIHSLGCTGIEFVGRVNVAEWYGRVDLVLLSSVSEGQPFVILEAMASRRPVVATDVGSCRELIEGSMDSFGNAGLIVPVMNPDQMAKAILRLYQDADMRQEMAEVGLKRVRASYREEDFLAAYEKLYLEVNDSGRSGL